VDLKVLFLLNIICFFCQGREEAHKVMKDENESKKRRATEAKQRRKQQSEKKKKLGQTESNDGGALEASNTDASKSETPQKPRKKKKHHHRKTNEAASSDDQLQIPTSASTILDNTIVQFLKTKESKLAEEDASLETKHKFIKEERKHKEKCQPQAAAANVNVRAAHIVVLNAESNAPPVMEKALEFRRNHFYGAHLKRSAAMLPSI
jgi:hypothetical protein